MLALCRECGCQYSQGEEILSLCDRSGGIPLAPHLYLPQFLDEKKERDLALFMDIALLSKCAELWVFGDIISDGMQKEIEYARRKRKPVRYIKEV